MTGGTLIAKTARLQFGNGRVVFNQTGGTLDLYGLLFARGSNYLVSLSNCMFKIGAGGLTSELLGGVFRLGSGTTLNFESSSVNTFQETIEVNGPVTLLAPNGAMLSTAKGIVSTTVSDDAGGVVSTGSVTVGDDATASSLTIKTPGMAPVTVVAGSTLVASTDGVTATTIPESSLTASAIYDEVTLQPGSTLVIASTHAVPIHFKGFAVPATGASKATLVLRGSTFNEGDVVLTWDPTTATGNINALTLTFEDPRFFLVIDAAEGTATVSSIEVTFTGTDTETVVSDRAKAYIIAMAKANTVGIKNVRISRSDANKAYLLNVIPGFGRHASDNSISVATLDCSFRVTDLQIVNGNVIATAAINATVFTEMGEGGPNGTLELIASETIDGDFTSVEGSTPVAGEQLSVKAPIVVGKPFYKLRISD